MAIADDHFDSLLSLEDDFYKEGYELGVKDGQRAGLIEGRLFGLEKGFEKYVAMGRLHGRAAVWAGRLPVPDSGDTKEVANGSDVGAASRKDDEKLLSQSHQEVHVTPLPENPRLEAHIRTLYALAEPGSLSIENSEDAVSEFDDRLKRAEGKVKVIEKLTGESSIKNDIQRSISDTQGSSTKDTKNSKGDGSIEDISSLHVRH